MSLEFVSGTSASAIIERWNKFGLAVFVFHGLNEVSEPDKRKVIVDTIKEMAGLSISQKDMQALISRPHEGPRADEYAAAWVTLKESLKKILNEQIQTIRKMKISGI